MDGKESITLAYDSTELIEKFDIIEYLQEKWDFDTKVPLIKSNQDE